MKRKVSFPGKTKLGVTFGKGKNANVVKTVADGGLFADKGVEAGWSVVKVNRTSVDHKSALDALKKALKRDGNVKLEFQVPIKAGAGSLNVMFEGKKKCGFALEPKSTIVKHVDKRSAAGKGGVQKGWSVVAVDGVMVDEENIRSELRRISKSQRKYQVIFGSPRKKNRNKMLMSIQASPGESKDNDQELKAQEDAEQKVKAEAEENAKLDSEQEAMEVAEQKVKVGGGVELKRSEAEQREREVAKKLAREEEGKLAKEEAEKKAKEEAEQKESDEAEQRAREEAEQKAKWEAEQRAKEEAEQRAKEEAEQRAKQEAEQKEREVAEKKAKEAEQKSQDKAWQKTREEADQKEEEEAERKAQEEAERRAQDEAEMKVKEEAEQKKCADAELLVKKDEEQKPSAEPKPLASKKVEEKTEGAETALPETRVKSVAQAQVEVEPRPESTKDKPTASDGLGSAATAEVPTQEQKAENIPKDDDVVKEETIATEYDVVEDIKQTDEASVHDAAMKGKPQPEEGEEASKETLPSAKDADESEVVTDAQLEARTECKETPSDKPVEKDDSTDNKMEPVAESGIIKSSNPIEETEIKSKESDQILADKLELFENNKINSKHTEEKDISVATADPVSIET